MTTAIVGLIYFAALSFGTALSDDVPTAAFRAFMATLFTILALVLLC